MIMIMIILDRDEKDAVDPEKLRFEAALSIIIIHPDAYLIFVSHVSHGVSVKNFK